MNKISKKLKELAIKKEGALIIGTVPGYPDIKTGYKIIEKIINSGADILELSPSSSNPTADGATLRRAHQKVLGSGITKKQIFDLYKKITGHFDIPIFVVEYVDVIYEIGLDKYFKQLKGCGIDTLIILGISLEELEPFYNFSVKNNINLALTISPASSDESIKLIAKKSKSFVYCALTVGVTGARKHISFDSVEFIKRARKIIKLPLIAGFGISCPKQIKVLSKYEINGFVICSKVIEIINENLSNKKKMMNSLEKYIKSMKRAKFKIKNRAQEFWRRF